MSKKEISRMDLNEFIRDGYLQEANRLFFHPLGLALSAAVSDDGEVKLSGIYDCREEGIVFAPGDIELEKVAKVRAQAERHRPLRQHWTDDDGVQKVYKP